MSADQGMSCCPDTMELNALHDGLEVSPGVAEHATSCDACIAVLAAYRRADAALRRCLTPPADLKDRIRVAVEELSVRPSVAPRWYMTPVFRLAAAFVVTVGALGVLVAVLGRGPQHDTGTAVAETTTTQDGPNLAGAPSTNEALINSAQGATKLVGATSGNDASLAASMLPAKAVIPAHVRHVWSVDDVDEGMRHLKQRLPEGAYLAGVENGNPFIQVTLPDEQVQRLVDDLADRKWRLVNNDTPQPQQPAAFTHHDVRYRLVLAGRND